MKLAKAKEYYQLDLLDGFTATPVPDGYMLAIDHHGNIRQGSTLETAQGVEKIYSTLSAVNADVERITEQRAAWTMKI